LRRSIRQGISDYAGSGAAPFDQPYSFFIAELFKIVDGKINRIEALVTPVPYGMSTGWVKR
jgi:hypothetical protein